MVCDTSNVWLLSFAAEHANIVEFFEYFCRIEYNDTIVDTMSSVLSRCVVLAHELPARTLGHRTQINRSEWYIVTAEIHSTARNRVKRGNSEANELSAIECDARPRWRVPKVISQVTY